MELRHALGTFSRHPQAASDRAAGESHAVPRQTDRPDRLPDGLPGRRRTGEPARTSGHLHADPDLQPRLPQHFRQAVLDVRARNISHEVQGEAVLLIRLVPAIYASPGEFGGCVRQEAGTTGARRTVGGHHHHMHVHREFDFEVR